MLTINTARLIIKLVALLIMGMYMVFAFILWRQVHIMNKCLSTPARGLFAFAALAHLLSSVALLALTTIAL
jgi:hypothetical protein